MVLGIEFQMDEMDQFDWKLKIEAIIFQAGGKLSLEEISKMIPEIPINLVKKLMKELILQYQKYDSALEIYQLGDKEYIFQTKNHILYDPRVEKFTKGSDFKPSEVKTLAFIAYYQPAEFQDIVDFVGSGVKQAVQRLIKRNFISVSKVKFNALNEEGDEFTINSKEYRTTKNFADYLGIDDNIDLIRDRIQEFLQ